MAIFSTIVLALCAILGVGVIILIAFVAWAMSSRSR